jgi:hypothetical protein
MLLFIGIGRSAAQLVRPAFEYHGLTAFPGQFAFGSVQGPNAAVAPLGLELQLTEINGHKLFVDPQKAADGQNHTFDAAPRIDDQIIDFGNRIALLIKDVAADQRTGANIGPGQFLSRRRLLLTDCARTAAAVMAA